MDPVIKAPGLSTKSAQSPFSTHIFLSRLAKYTILYTEYHCDFSIDPHPYIIYNLQRVGLLGRSPRTSFITYQAILGTFMSTALQLQILPFWELFPPERDMLIQKYFESTNIIIIMLLSIWVHVSIMQICKLLLLTRRFTFSLSCILLVFKEFSKPIEWH